jgi:hypothetical protein
LKRLAISALLALSTPALAQWHVHNSDCGPGVFMVTVAVLVYEPTWPNDGPCLVEYWSAMKIALDDLDHCLDGQCAAILSECAPGFAQSCWTNFTGECVSQFIVDQAVAIVNLNGCGG